MKMEPDKLTSDESVLKMKFSLFIDPTMEEEAVEDDVEPDKESEEKWRR